MALTLKEAAKKRGVLAWAPVSKSGEVLRDLRGHFAVYTYRKDADQDCPSYGVVRRVRVTVIEERK